MKLSDLHPNALSAAMRGGTESWGTWGSVNEHIRYAQPVSSRGRCHCGCKGRRTHNGMCNGVALASGCEFYVRRWVNAGRSALSKEPGDG